MKKTIFLLLCIFSFALLCGCTSDNTDITVTDGDTVYELTGYNTVTSNALFDKNYAPDGVPSPVFKAPAKGVVLTYYTDADGEQVKAVTPVASEETCVIPLNGCSVFLKTDSVSDTFTVSGYTLPDYTDIASLPSVTDESGTAGFLLSHKDPVSFEGVTAALFSPTVDSVEIPDGYFAVYCSRNIYGGFKTVEFDVSKTTSKHFTLVVSDSYAKGFAAAFMEVNGMFNINNSDKLTPYGTNKTVVIDETHFTVNGINPKECGDGIFVYDADYGLSLAPEREGDFVDIYVFDGIVAYISNKNTRTPLPFPSGYAICFNGEESVKKAEAIKIGDKAEALLFTPFTTPVNYVEVIRDGSSEYIDVFYRNEARTTVTEAVLYDSNYFWNSTRTNQWGTEVAFTSDGEYVTISHLGVSGDTPIPEGGYVISVGDNVYASYLKPLPKGGSLRYVQNDSMYSFRKIKNVVYGSAGEGEYIAVLSGISVTPAAENALELAVDKNGYIQSAHFGGGTPVPEGGCVISATGVKKNELSRIYTVGSRIITYESTKTLYIFTEKLSSLGALTSEYDSTLAALKATEKDMLVLDYKKAYSLAEQTRELLEKAASEPMCYTEAAESLALFKQACIPSLQVQDRSAWVVHYETDESDVKHIVEYAASLGINRLIVSPFRDTYALYRTELENLSVHPDLPEGQDMLKAYVDACHENGIEIYFMYCCFNTGSPENSYPETHYVNLFSDSRLLSKAGRDVAYFYSEPSYTLNPYDGDVRAFNLAVIQEICESYAVDGIQLDYIRFPLPTYYGESNYEDHGYNADITAAFMAKYGTSLNPVDMPITHELWDEWCAFRCDIITSFAAEASRLVKQYDLTFSCTCFASASDRAKYVFQDVGTWAEMGIIDEIYPMIYSATLEGQKQYGDELKAIVGDNCRIILGVGTYDGETDEVIRKQVEYSYNLGTDGNSTFALEYIQGFRFDSVYAGELYRTSAVRTNEYGETVTAYCAQLKMLAENYMFLHPSERDLSGFVAELDRIAEEYGSFRKIGKTYTERLLYIQNVISEFNSLLSTESLPECLQKHVQSIVSALVRTENTLK